VPVIGVAEDETDGRADSLRATSVLRRPVRRGRGL